MNSSLDRKALLPYAAMWVEGWCNWVASYDFSRNRISKCFSTESFYTSNALPHSSICSYSCCLHRAPIFWKAEGGDLGTHCWEAGRNPYPPHLLLVTRKISDIVKACERKLLLIFFSSYLPFTLTENCIGSFIIPLPWQILCSPNVNCGFLNLNK